MQVEDDLVLPVDVLVRSISVNRDTSHAFFLGAGASIAAGIPGVETCIWEWKRDIYLTNHPGANGSLRDVSLPETRQTIQTWLNQQSGYPAPGSCGEYGFYVEQCYPIPADRRQYFQNLAEQAEPTVGHHLLCLLAEAEVVKSVWTTNFDNLVLRAAAASHITPIEVTLDTAARIQRQPRRGELLHVSLHGEYRYDALKNTDAEVQEQDQLLRDALVKQLADHTLIISGYSGRDDCIMETLKAAYVQTCMGRLYWCGYQAERPTSQIEDLLLTAREHGCTAYYVPTEGFDELLMRLAFHCLSGEQFMRARDLITSSD
jgi:hypothetical protein